MHTFDCLKKELKLSGRFVLEASAGTGKTFAIEHVVTRLLIESDEPMPLEQLLIVTFTKAATRDLKQRIHANFLTTLAMLKKRASPHDFVAQILEDEKKTVQAIYALENALIELNDANIYTIHSFCHQMLSRFALEAKISPQLLDHQDEQYLSTITTNILDTLRSLNESDGFCVEQIRILLSSTGNDLSKLVRKLILLFEKESIETTPSFEDHYKEFLTIEMPNDLNETYQTVASSYKGLCDRDKKPHPHFMEQIKALEKKDFCSLIGVTKWVFAFLKLENRKKQGIFSDELEKMSSTLYALLKRATDSDLLLKRIAAIAKKRQADTISPDGILHLMLKSLKFPSFLRQVQGLYQGVIIDEFQDTDPIQWEIFRSLFLCSTKDIAHFLVVGDPKQSIYAFRNADLETFFKAARFIGKENHYALSTNYRSHPSLIAALNHLFDEETLNLSYKPIQAGLKDLPDPFEDKKGSIHFMEFFQPNVRGRTWPSIDSETSILFPRIAKEMNTLVKLDAFSYSSIAILVKDRFQATRLSSYLKSVNIPVLSSATTSLVDSPAYCFFETFLELLITPSNIGKIKYLLGLPLVGLTFHELIDLDMQAYVTIFKELKSIYEKKGLAASFASFFHAPIGRQNTSLVNTLLLSKDLSSYGDLTQLIEIALLQKTDLPNLISYFFSLKALGPEEEPLLARRPPSEGDSVTIMTTHASKGLEFDIVFALGLASRSKPSEKENEETLIKLDQEKLRLFYVALTRAKYRVYVPHAFSDEIAPFGETSATELFFEKRSSLSEHPLITKEALTPFEFKQETQSKSQTPLVCPKRFTRGFSLEKILSFSSLFHTSPPPPLPPDESVLPAGAETGNVVHLIFEKVITKGLYRPFNKEQIEKIITHEVAFTPLQAWESEIFEMVERAFSTPLLNFTLGDIEPNHMLCEMPFHYKCDDSGTMKGFCDLIFSYEGLYYLLDWKTNRLENYEEKTLEKTMKSHLYVEQAKIYTQALNKLLAKRDPRPFNEIFGGTIYLFLRGLPKGVYFIPPSKIEVAHG